MFILNLGRLHYFFASLVGGVCRGYFSSSEKLVVSSQHAKGLLPWERGECICRFPCSRESWNLRTNPTLPDKMDVAPQPKN